jgi:hypothetical protein
MLSTLFTYWLKDMMCDGRRGDFGDCYQRRL